MRPKCATRDVDENVDAPESLVDITHRAVIGILIGDVDDDRAPMWNGGHNIRQPIPLPVDTDDPRASLGKLPNSRLADALRGAGDYRHPFG